MQKVLFILGQQGCPGCYKRIEDYLKRQRGIISVMVFPAIGRIRTEYDESEINEEQLENHIKNLGYVVETRRQLDKGEIRVLKYEN